MSTQSISTRRSFFWKAGAVLSAPLAIATVNASEGKINESDILKTQLADMEDINAIRLIQQSYAKHLNTQTNDELAALFVNPESFTFDESIRHLSTNHFGEEDYIELAADRKTAVASAHYTVQIESPLADCPLVDMARQQGGGVLKSTENRVVENTFIKQGEVWKIKRSNHRIA